jgi:hypothetical protein
MESAPVRVASFLPIQCILITYTFNVMYVQLNDSWYHNIMYERNSLKKRTREFLSKSLHIGILAIIFRQHTFYNSSYIIIFQRCTNNSSSIVIIQWQFFHLVKSNSSHIIAKLYQFQRDRAPRRTPKAYMLTVVLIKIRAEAFRTCERYIFSQLI